jgi:hypothetical protein
MRSLAEQEAIATKARGRDPDKWGILRLDNVQQYIRQRDMRIGRENKMQIGIAATYFETEAFVRGAADLDDKRKRIAENKRKDLTVDLDRKLVLPEPVARTAKRSTLSMTSQMPSIWTS